MHRHQFSRSINRNPRPYSFYWRPIRQNQIEFSGRIRNRIGPFQNECSRVHSSRHLPPDYPAFAKTLIRMSAKHITLFANGLSDIVG